MNPRRSLTRADLENDRLREMFRKAYPMGLDRVRRGVLKPAA